MADGVNFLPLKPQGSRKYFCKRNLKQVASSGAMPQRKDVSGGNRGCDHCEDSAGTGAPPSGPPRPPKESPESGVENFSEGDLNSRFFSGRSRDSASLETPRRVLTDMADLENKTSASDSKPVNKTRPLPSSVEVAETEVKTNETRPLPSSVEVAETTEVKTNETRPLPSSVEVANTTEVKTNETRPLPSNPEVANTTEVKTNETQPPPSNLEVAETTEVKTNETRPLPSSVEVAKTTEIKTNETRPPPSDPETSPVVVADLLAGLDAVASEWLNIREEEISGLFRCVVALTLTAMDLPVDPSLEEACGGPDDLSALMESIGQLFDLGADMEDLEDILGGAVLRGEAWSPQTNLRSLLRRKQTL